MKMIISNIAAAMLLSVAAGAMDPLVENSNVDAGYLKMQAVKAKLALLTKEDELLGEKIAHADTREARDTALKNLDFLTKNMKKIEEARDTAFSNIDYRIKDTKKIEEKHKESEKNLTQLASQWEEKYIHLQKAHEKEKADILLQVKRMKEDLEKQYRINLKEEAKITFTNNQRSEGRLRNTINYLKEKNDDKEKKYNTSCQVFIDYKKVSEIKDDASSKKIAGMEILNRKLLNQIDGYKLAIEDYKKEKKKMDESSKKRQRSNAESSQKSFDATTKLIGQIQALGGNLKKRQVEANKLNSTNRDLVTELKIFKSTPVPIIQIATPILIPAPYYFVPIRNLAASDLILRKKKGRNEYDIENMDI